MLWKNCGKLYGGVGCKVVYCVYYKNMWIRSIGKKGGSLNVTLPREALVALGWEREDMVCISMHSGSELRITKVNLATLPDRVREAVEPLPEIKYG